jgi:hypothetical protein
MLPLEVIIPDQAAFSCALPPSGRFESGHRYLADQLPTIAALKDEIQARAALLALLQLGLPGRRPMSSGHWAGMTACTCCLSAGLLAAAPRLCVQMPSKPPTAPTP